jgi:hypothetical protein
VETYITGPEMLVTSCVKINFPPQEVRFTVSLSRTHRESKPDYPTAEVDAVIKREVWIVRFRGSEILKLEILGNDTNKSKNHIHEKITSSSGKN